MDIKCKLYPYPVLSFYSDDYVDSSFDTEIDVTKDGYDIRIDFLSSLNNAELEQYLTEGKVKFVYHLECAQTGYRTALQTSENEFVHIISEKKICGRLQVCPFIVASTDIQNYVNALFNEDYSGFMFQIEAGCVMAVGKQVNFDIEKDINDLTYTPSIFVISKNIDENTTDMLVSMDQKKIVIKLPEKGYYNYRSIKEEPEIKPLLNSLIIIPALIYVLEELSRREANERYILYSSYGWYRAIKKTLMTRFNCDIENETFSELNMVEIAQKLIGSPLLDGFQVLSNGYASMVEEDEE